MRISVLQITNVGSPVFDAYQLPARAAQPDSSRGDCTASKFLVCPIFPIWDCLEPFQARMSPGNGTIGRPQLSGGLIGSLPNSDPIAINLGP
jgi:hypothetical protein